MRRLTRNLLTNGRVSAPRNGALLGRLPFKTTPLLTISGCTLQTCGPRFQSTFIEEKYPEVEVSEASETLSSSISPLFDHEPSTTPDISPSQDIEASTVSDGSNIQETASYSYTPLIDDESLSTTPITPRTAYIAIGSNIGNRISWIEKALVLLKQPGNGITVKRTSSLWETEPMYVTDQGKFLNGVIEIETFFPAHTLLHRLQNIEKTLGREKLQEKGPRNIDLDILLLGKKKVNTKDLIIPHLLMLEREFVLRPLAELIPDMQLDPSQPGKTTTDFLNALPPASSPMLSVSYLTTDQRYAALKPLDPKRKTHIMGILNLTPDSFSDGGKHSLVDVAPSELPVLEELPKTESKKPFKYPSSLKRFITSFDSGNNPTSIIDIGGQSTAPGAPEVTAEEETARVIDFIQRLHNRPFRNQLISIDTYRASVAKAAIEAGAHIVNDISAGQLDPEMLPMVARSRRTIILMHMRGTPQTMTQFTNYEPLGLIPTIAQELLQRVAEAQNAGIPKWRIILDPGIGFAKTADQNLEILRRFDELRNWPGLKGFPWLVGASRKGFIGKATGVESPEKRMEGSLVVAVAAIQGGADLVRVHDVKETMVAAKMADAVWRV